MVIIALFSFNATPSLVFPIEEMSLRWYRTLMDNPSFVASLINSLKVGSATTAATTGLGTLTGLAMIRMAKRSHAFLEYLSMAPIGLPGLFLGIGLVTFFSRIGLPRSLVTVAIGHVLFTYPFFVEAMRSRVVYSTTAWRKQRVIWARPPPRHSGA